MSRLSSTLRRYNSTGVLDRLISDNFKSADCTSIPKTSSSIFEKTNNILDTSKSLFSTSNRPAMDMVEVDGKVKITIDVPGFSADDITVNLSGSTLYIRAYKNDVLTNIDKSTVYYTSERKTGEMIRYIKLPINANVHRVTAKYKEGVLHIEAPITPYGDMGRKIYIERD